MKGEKYRRDPGKRWVGIARGATQRRDDAVNAMAERANNHLRMLRWAIVTNPKDNPEDWQEILDYVNQAVNAPSRH